MSNSPDLKYLEQVELRCSPRRSHCRCTTSRLFTETLATNGLLYEMVEERSQADWQGRGIELVKLASGWRLFGAR